MTKRISAEEYQRLCHQGRANKYHAQPIEVDGIRFDSKAEAHRYEQLKLMQRAGEIDYLSVHPSYIVWEHPWSDYETIAYVADFEYMDVKTGQWITEDVKGSKATVTPAAKLKHKLFRGTCTKYELRLVDKHGREI